MARALRWLAWVMGVACLAIGLGHLSFGVLSVPGEATAGPTVDSRERYYGAIFAGYGLAWIWAARQRPVPAVVVRWLAGIFLLGAVGRILSLILVGVPQVFQVVLTVMEVVLPPLFFWLATADEKAMAQERTVSRPEAPRADPTSA
jgi:hypothetical protein